MHETISESIYPEIASSESVTVLTDGGPNGENVLDFNRAGTPYGEDYQTSGLVVHKASVRLGGNDDDRRVSRNVARRLVPSIQEEEQLLRQIDKALKERG